LYQFLHALTLVTLIQLKYIVAVDTYRHFATAAEHCFVTQPTLSMQIAKLEKELDLLIFDRSKHPVAPTPAGARILEQARTILRETERLEELVKQSKGQKSGVFWLGIIPTVSPSLVPRFLRAFTHKYPEIHLRIEELQTEQILEKIDRNELDAGIMATPLHVPHMVELPLYYEPFMAYIPQGHRLENEEFILHSELNADDLLVLRSGHCFRNQVLELCGTDARNRINDLEKFGFESGNFETIMRLARQGFGMTLIPYLTALDLSEEERRFVKPLDQPQPTREISLVYPKTLVKTAIAHLLAEEIQHHVPKKLLTLPTGIAPIPAR
jgi:LysR family hydrogen peroxide-inducible transcriptional activator